MWSHTPDKVLHWGGHITDEQQSLTVQNYSSYLHPIAV